jgi:hypothetical protein
VANSSPGCGPEFVPKIPWVFQDVMQADGGSRDHRIVEIVHVVQNFKAYTFVIDILLNLISMV